MKLGATSATYRDRQSQLKVLATAVVTHDHSTAHMLVPNRSARCPVSTEVVSPAERNSIRAGTARDISFRQLLVPRVQALRFSLQRVPSLLMNRASAAHRLAHALATALTAPEAPL